MLEHKIHKCHKNEYNSCPQSYWSVLQLETYSGTHTPLHGHLPHLPLWPLKPFPTMISSVKKTFSQVLLRYN